MSSKVTPISLGTGKYIAVGESIGDWTCLRPAQVKRAYNRSENLRDLAARFRISPFLARKMLSLAMVNYVIDLYVQYQGDKTCAEIARENGMKVATLTELFRDQGLLVKRGRKRTNIKRKGARRLWALTGTINRFSKALGVHWATGKKILNSYRLLESTGNAPSYRLALPP